jgi:hypothetical protein
MIYSSINLSPSNQAVDPTKDIVFTWITRGATQSDFKLTIYKNDDNTLIYDSMKITSSNNYHTVPSNSMAVGINYKWQIQTWSGVSSAISQFAFISANSSPTLVFIDPDFSSAVILPGQNYMFKTLYNQSENISISKYKFILYDNNDNILEDTGYIYGFTPYYEFKGMVRGNTYKIEAKAVSQNNLSCETGIKEFSINTYTIPDTTPDIIVTPNNDEASIKTEWSDLKLVTPVVIGTYSYIPAKFNEGVLLDESTTIDYQELVVGNDNILSGWYKFVYGQDGDFVQLGSNVFGGFDYNTQRFYIRNNTTYAYSQQFGLYTWDDLGNTTWENWTGDWRNPGFDPTELTNHWFFIAINNTMSLTAYCDDVLAFVLSTNIDVTNSFSSIKFTGKILLDNMRADNKSMTFAEIDSISKTSPQLWIVPTNWLANFDNTLEAGNISNNVPVVGWRLKRRKVGEDLFITVGDFDKDVREYIDRTPANKTEYIYSIYSLSSEGEGLGLEGQTGISFTGWFLINSNTDKWFKFDTGFDGLKTDKIPVVQDSKVFKKQDKFPTVAYGLQEYREGQITAVPYVMEECLMKTDKEVLDYVKSLILDKQVKILKNAAGYVMLVSTHEFEFEYQDKVSSQPYQVSFAWVEVGESNLTE